MHRSASSWIDVNWQMQYYSQHLIDHLLVYQDLFNISCTKCFFSSAFSGVLLNWQESKSPRPWMKLFSLLPVVTLWIISARVPRSLDIRTLSMQPVHQTPSENCRKWERFRDVSNGNFPFLPSKFSIFYNSLVRLLRVDFLWTCVLLLEPPA